MKKRSEYPKGRAGTIEYHRGRAKWHTDQATALEADGKAVTDRKNARAREKAKRLREQAAALEAGAGVR